MFCSLSGYLTTFLDFFFPPGASGFPVDVDGDVDTRKNNMKLRTFLLFQGQNFVRVRPGDGMGIGGTLMGCLIQSSTSRFACGPWMQSGTGGTVDDDRNLDINVPIFGNHRLHAIKRMRRNPGDCRKADRNLDDIVTISFCQR